MTLLNTYILFSDAGSDLQGIRTNAKRDGDDFILNGSKVFITNGILADVVVVVAITDANAKGQLISKCPNGKSVSSKIPTKLFLDFCPEIFCGFVGASWKLFGLPVGFLIYDTQEGARHCRKPLGRRSVGSKISIVIIIYTFVTFTVSNIDFHELLRRILE